MTQQGKSETREKAAEMMVEQKKEPLLLHWLSPQNEDLVPGGDLIDQ